MTNRLSAPACSPFVGYIAGSECHAATVGEE